VLWKKKENEKKSITIKVSILILLESALKEKGRHCFRKNLACFNPYSAGKCSERICTTGRQWMRHWFQSLFCWKVLWKIPSWYRGSDSDFRFNPYSAGKCSERRKEETKGWHLMNVSILILLESALKGFCVSPFLYRQTAVSILILLESALKVWRNSAGYKGRNYWFQSLFCWKVLWKSHRQPSAAGLLGCFNPYSAGKCSERFCAIRYGLLSTVVSILILLESALKVGNPTPTPTPTTGFNPYSAGKCSESRNGRVKSTL